MDKTCSSSNNSSCTHDPDTGTVPGSSLHFFILVRFAPDRISIALVQETRIEDRSPLHKRKLAGWPHWSKSYGFGLRQYGHRITMLPAASTPFSRSRERHKHGNSST
eukprot:scpid21605/ scgid6711/ 